VADARNYLLRRTALVLENAVIDADLGIVTGSIGGRAVRCKLTHRGDGSGAVAWTEVHVETGGPTVQLELRPQSLLETIDVHRGIALDITTGDAEFDRAFIVEGAPGDAVREVLDPALRATLLRLGGEIDLTQPGNSLLLGRKGWAWGEQLAVLATTAGTLASRMAAVAAARGQHGQGVYRAPNAEMKSSELEALARARSLRAKKPLTRTVVLLTVAGLFFAAWLASIFWPRR
jgi:hypothetical protein